MTRLQRICLVLAALAGFASVLAAAYATHGVSNPEARDWMHTGATYALDQALAVFAAVFVASQGGRRAMAAAVLFLIGIVLFCGSPWAPPGRWRWRRRSAASPSWPAGWRSPGLASRSGNRPKAAPEENSP